MGNTIQGSIGLDLNPLRSAALQAAAIGRKIKTGMQASMRISSGGLAKGITSGLGAALSGLKYLSGAAAGAGAALAFGVDRAYGLGRALNELHEQTDISVAKLMVMRQAFKDSDIEAEALGPTINKMQRNLEAAAEGNKKVLRTFELLHLSLSDLQQMKPDEQFSAIGSAIAAMDDPTKRAYTSMTLFGKSGGRFLGLFANGGALSSAATAIGSQAKLLDENSATFEAISVRLGRAGLKLQGFFVGVAARLADTLLPILAKFDKLDLAGIGERFGAALIRGTQFLVGAFKNPKAFIGVLTDALVYGMLQAGNVLLATLKTARMYFQDGMLETIMGIGDVLLGVLVKAFQVPIAFFQAGIDAALAKLPESLGGSGEKRQGKAAEKRMRDISAEEIGMAKALSSNDPSVRDAARAKVKALVKEYGEQANIANRSNMSVADRAAGYMASPVKVATASGEMTGDELIKQGRDNLMVGLSKAALSIGKITVKDVTGAGEYKTAIQSGFTALANAGAPLLAQATAPTPTLNGKEVSPGRLAQLRGEFGADKANEMVYGKELAATMNRPMALSPGALAQLQGTFGADKARSMLTSGGTLAAATATGNAGAPVAVRPSAGFGLFSSGALTTVFDRDRARLGLHAGVGGGAYNVIHRGDAKRREAAAQASSKGVDLTNEKLDKLLQTQADQLKELEEFNGA